MKKRKIVLNDKAKIAAVIEELDQKKNEALTKAWEQVNKVHMLYNQAHYRICVQQTQYYSKMPLIKTRYMLFYVHSIQLHVYPLTIFKDFSSIFSTLLPGARAKLSPPEGQSALDGLEVRVGFGDVWKESLSELSGGQRSVPYIYVY